MRRSLRTAIVVIAAALVLAGCEARAVDNEQVPPQVRIIVRFSHVVAENTPKGLAARRFADLVRTRSGGRIEVDVFPNSMLYADVEEFQALKDNKIQLIAPSTSLVADLVPEWQILDLPFLFSADRQVSEAMDGELGTQLMSRLGPTGMTGLAFWPNGFRVMTDSVRPLRLPADFQGLRMRYQASEIRRRQFELWGAIPIRDTFADLYRLLEQDEADGQENTLSNIESKRLYEVQRYMTLSNHQYLGYVVLANGQWWNGLAQADRDLLAGALADATSWLRDNASQINQQALDTIRSSRKVDIHELTPAEKQAWVDAIDPLYRDLPTWLPPDLVTLVQNIRSEGP